MSPQSFISSYAPRLRQYANPLIAPVVPQTTSVAPGTRTTKRGTVAINYAENELDDDDLFEDGESRRATGLRSRREESGPTKDSTTGRLGREINSPVQVQGIWRDWMGRLRQTNIIRSDLQRQTPTLLPLTLIPIRIDVDVAPFIPPPALPLPPDYQNTQFASTNPAYKSAEPTLPQRLKDYYLWNLHEGMITPDQYATQMVQDLDLPPAISGEIATQTRKQLEEYAGVALHPLFHRTHTSGKPAPAIPVSNKRPRTTLSRESSKTPLPAAPTNGFEKPDVRGVAEPLPLGPDGSDPYDPNDPDDAYRCILKLSFSLRNQHYTDQFEWSLLHPVGFPEEFAKVTCADLGLTGEWVSAVTHATYEAVLKRKKEVCESGALMGSVNSFGGDLDNMAMGEGGAGIRYDPENLCEDWAPKLETLSKEEIEKKEGDRERHLRRLRRETARFSTTTNVMPEQRPTDEEPQALGRGERAKKKRRFRSLSPQGRSTPEVGSAGYGGVGVGLLSDWERQSWRCAHCRLPGNAAWGVRDGPNGPRTLCQNCGLIYERDGRLAPHMLNLHGEPPQASRRQGHH